MYDFSNYGSYDRLSDDGITEWHPAFLSLGESLDECAKEYRKFCDRYKPQPKPEKRSYWGSKLLPKVLKASERKKRSPGQLRLLWNEWEPTQRRFAGLQNNSFSLIAMTPKLPRSFSMIHDG